MIEGPSREAIEVLEQKLPVVSGFSGNNIVAGGIPSD